MNENSAVASIGGAALLDASPPGRDRFEYLEVGGDMALVRLALPRSSVDGHPYSVQLTVTIGQSTTCLTPLPGADGNDVETREIDGTLQAGFSVPLELVRDPRAKFAVSVDENQPYELPSPAPREPGPQVWRQAESAAMAELRCELADVRARAEREQERVCLLQDVLVETRQSEETGRDEAAGATKLLDQARDERDDARLQLEALTVEARNAAEQWRGRQGAFEARVQELVEAEESTRAQVQARDQELEGERERRAQLEARVQELVEAEESTRAQVQARDQELEGSVSAGPSSRRGCRSLSRPRGPCGLRYWRVITSWRRSVSAGPSSRRGCRSLSRPERSLGPRLRTRPGTSTASVCCSKGGCRSLSRLTSPRGPSCRRGIRSWRVSVSARVSSRRGCRSLSRPRRPRGPRCRHVIRNWRVPASARPRWKHGCRSCQTPETPARPRLSGFRGCSRMLARTSSPGPLGGSPRQRPRCGRNAHG